MKRKQQTYLTLAGCVLMLASLLMPIVSVATYGWNLSEVLQKMPPLMTTGQQWGGAVLLSGMVLMPLWLAFSWLRGRRPQRWTLVLTLACPLLLATVLLVSSSPVAPAFGLWVYIAVAAVLLVLHMKK